MALEQEGFRWRNDDGSEGAGSPEGASWKAAQDENASIALDTRVRLRFVVNHTGGELPGASKYRLEYRRVGSPTEAWAEVEPTGSPASAGKVRLAPSANITAGGEDTTAQLAPPAGSPKSFTAGRIWDDESGQDSITIGADQYTELEFCVEAVEANGAQASDVFEFRVTRSITTVVEEGDEHFASVVLLAGNDNAADASTTFDDQSGSNHTLTAAGDVQYDSAQAPTGMTTSIQFDGTGDWILEAAHANYGFGTGDWTIEFMARASSLAAVRMFIDLRKSLSTDPQPAIFVNTLGNIFFQAADTNRITSGNSAFVVDTWYHIAVCKASGTTKMFKDGTQVGSDFTDSLNYGADGELRLGASFADGQPHLGWLANIRITKGVARYPGNFTPPDLPLLSS